MSAVVVAPYIAVAVGVKTLLNDGGGGGGGGGNQAYDPYAQYRPQAASDLSALMKDPSKARSDPGYQQQLQEGTRTAEAAAAASGKLQSGQESAALQSLGQGTFANYYQTMLSNLSALSGASQSPAQAQAAAAKSALEQQQAAGIKQQMQMGGLQTLLGGVAGVNKANNLTPSYSNDYGYTPNNSWQGSDYNNPYNFTNPGYSNYTSSPAGYSDPGVSSSYGYDYSM